MGSGSSLSTCANARATIDATHPSGNKRREPQSPRQVYFCHCCKSFSYDSFANNVGPSGTCPPLVCPQPFCRPNSVGQLEEIPSSIEGSLRLQVIMLELINSRAIARPRPTKQVSAGVQTVDILLDIEIVNLNSESTGEQQICSVCNDNFGSSQSPCQSPCRHNCGNDEEDASGQHAGMKLQCGHIFHQSCILPWLAAHQTCPCCRAEVRQCHQIIPSPAELALRFSEEQLTRKIKFGLNSESYLMAKKIEGLMMSDKKEDNQLLKVDYTIDNPSSPHLCGQCNIDEMANRLHGLLLRVKCGTSE